MSIHKSEAGAEIPEITDDGACVGVAMNRACNAVQTLNSALVVSSPSGHYGKGD